MYCRSKYKAGTSNTDSLFIEDLKKNMATKHYGYFSSFLDEFSELMFSKNTSDAYTVATYLSVLIKTHAKQGSFSSMGDDILLGIGVLLSWFDSLTAARVQQQAGVLHHVMQVKDKSMSKDMNNLVDFYDKMFTKEEGQKLFESLELFFIYPEANVSLKTVGERIFAAAATPFFKSQGTRKHKRLVQLLLMATHDMDPYFRAHTGANYHVKDRYQAELPERRSMNYKNIVKHLIIEHPKLFKKLKRHYKHDKKNKHHNFSHKQKRHHNYRKNRNKNLRHGLPYEPEQITQGTDTESNDKLENQEVVEDSGKSDAYYGENPKVNQENIHNVKFTQTRKKLLDKLKRRRMPLETESRERKLLKGTRTATLSIVEHPDEDQADPQYLKQLANSFLKKRQQNQNIKKNRRFNFQSEIEDIGKHSQDLIENEMLHKVREVSSYSDEEDHLRMNLNDALRHGNKTFVSFRKSKGDLVINKQTLRDLSTELDEEWILKKNIYKVFEQDK